MKSHLCKRGLNEAVMTDMHFIKGATSAGASGRSQNVYNPATGAVTSSVPLASAAEIDAAVAVATVSYTHLRAHET